jgi:hypothetical protein
MRRAPRGWLAVPLLAVALAAGCGGGGGKTYSASETQACLERAVTAAPGFAAVSDVSREDADYIALDAINGGYFVTVGQTGVNVSFYRNGDDPGDALRAYTALGGSEGAKLYRKGNAVLAWDDTPTDDEKAAVDGCLATA